LLRLLLLLLLLLLLPLQLHQVLLLLLLFMLLLLVLVLLVLLMDALLLVVLLVGMGLRTASIAGIPCGSCQSGLKEGQHTRVWGPYNKKTSFLLAEVYGPINRSTSAPERGTQHTHTRTLKASVEELPPKESVEWPPNSGSNNPANMELPPPPPPPK
jgi:hypothetical protein